MAIINSIDEALQAVWNPRANILLLDIEKKKIEPGIFELNLYEYEYFVEDPHPTLGYHFSFITKMPDGFLSCPLVQLNIPTPNAKIEAAAWDYLVEGMGGLMYGLVDKYHIGKRCLRLTNISSPDYALIVSKTKALLKKTTEQSPQSYYLEHILPENVKRIRQKIKLGMGTR